MKIVARPMAATAFAALLCVAAAEAQPIDWTPLDAAVRAQIAAGEMPGAVAIIGDDQGIWLRRAWGSRAVQPQAEPMTVDTVFDLASLTKVVCTATAVLQLAEKGRLALDQPASRYWAAFGTQGKRDITIEQLLSHSSGLRPGLTLSSSDRAADVMRKLLAQAPTQPPGTALVYSDLNFIALGRIVERVSGQPLERYCHRHVFEPLGMKDTAFHPAAKLKPRIAPTESSGGTWLRGSVQDPTARRLGGVAGNAGLFGTADDLAKFAQALLRGGPSSPLSATTLRSLQVVHGVDAQATRHSLGWQLLPPLQAERESLQPAGTIGHTGYTGTGLWIDFVNRRFVVLLSSRLHPDSRGDARPLRRQVLALVSSLMPAGVPADPLPLQDAGPPVRTGLDVLRDEGYAPLQGLRVGLLTHLAAIDRHGWRSVDRLRRAPGVHLVKVFSPEHGLYGDVEGRVPSGTEAFSGLPLVSLYGEVRKPTPEMLAGLDAVVVDLQDAGERFFTYLSTLGEMLEAAAQAHVRVIVLDRPDPVRADRVGGPMLDPGLRSFTAFTVMPVLHGMTLGEMAQYLADELRRSQGLQADLQVIAMKGYRRSQWFDQTGLDWVPPSPNLRRFATAMLYPGVAWIEGANVSVGRGTAHPFELVGAPWIDGPRLVAALRERGVAGLQVQPADFTPEAGPYAGKTCHGASLKVTDRQAFDPIRLGAALVQTLSVLWPETFRAEATLGMVGSAQALADLRADVPLETLQQRWQADSEEFLRRRQAALIY